MSHGIFFFLQYTRIPKTCHIVYFFFRSKRKYGLHAITAKKITRCDDFFVACNYCKKKVYTYYNIHFMRNMSFTLTEHFVHIQLMA